MKNKRGISLIVLIVTIIVIIILAAAVILTISKNNPVESSREAKFKEDVRIFQDELALTVSKQYTDKQGQRDNKITTSDFNEMKNYIPSFKEEYAGKFCIVEDNLVGIPNKLNDKEKEYLNSLSVPTKVYSVGERVKLKDNNYWRVVNNNSNQYITLIREDFLSDKSVFDDNTTYGYQGSRIKYVLEHDYLPTLTSISGFVWDDNSSVRLLKWEEYTALKATKESSSWLYGNTQSYWWCTRMYELRALVYPDGTIHDDESGYSNNVRPVIVTSKDNIVL